MLADKLKILLGSTFVYYWKAHSFHANVEGRDFYQYHTLLQKVYEDVYETIDVIAEHIRTLDSYTPPTLARMCELSVIAEQPKIPRAELMFYELNADGEKLCQLINEVFELATAEKCENVANYMAELLDIYKKYGWFYKSTLKKERE